FGALAGGTSRARHGLNAGVTQAMIDCLRALGIEIEVSADEFLIHGGHWRPSTAPLDCRGSGATIRMLMGALAGQPFSSTLTGSPGLLRRPMGRVADPLRRMGARIAGCDGTDQPPLVIDGARLRGIDYALPVASAQVKTALLIAALSADGATTLHEPGPSRDHTERMLRSLGVSLTMPPASSGGEHLPAPTNYSVTLTSDRLPLPAFDLAVPGDFSSAAFLLIAALIVPGSDVVIRAVGVNPTRTGLLDALSDMGARVAMNGEHESSGEPVADLVVRANPLRGSMVHGERVVRMIDEFPIFAVAATQAEGETVVRDAAELRVKESDRIAAIVAELRKMGAAIEVREDGFVVEGLTPLHGARVESHGDHRLAMALAVAGLVAEGETVIDGAECIDESFPGFIDLMRSLRGSELRIADC
ncbi:MAG TPA: 3-phosphoshikimate 1-carboxyvinyltransferase, partial [Anaerolineae bacterium]